MKLVPTFARIRVSLDQRLLLDTRDAKIALVEGKAPFYLLPRTALRGELVPRGEQAEDGGALHDVVVDGHELTQPAVVYPEHDDLVRLEPLDLRAIRAHWNEAPELQWREEDLVSMPFARHPDHRVDVLPASEPVRVEVNGATVAQSERASFILESPLPARVYIPETDWVEGVLVPVDGGRTACPYKGIANYFDLHAGKQTFERAAWGYDRSAAPQNWVLPALDRLRAVIPSADIQIHVGDTRLPQ